MSLTCDYCDKEIDQAGSWVEISNNRGDGIPLDIPWDGNGSIEVKFWKQIATDQHYHEGCARELAVMELNGWEPDP